MKKILYIFLTIAIIIGGIVFLSIEEKTEIKAAAGPITAMKTRIDGYFYVPAIGPQSLKVVLLYDNSDIQGDQFEDSGEYPIMPNGVVDMSDLIFVQGHSHENEGDPNWEYMADITADRMVDISDIVIITVNWHNSGTYIDDINEINQATITFAPVGGEVGLNENGMCNIPAGATEFWVKDKNNNPIGAYILFYAGPAPTWPHISITAPANMTVNQEFLVSLTYTHDAAEQGGIHLRWLDDRFDITDKAGCDAEYYDDAMPPPNDTDDFAPGWEGIECSWGGGINSGDTKTFKLKSLAAGAQTLYYRAWDLPPAGPYVDCGGWLDYRRDPQSGVCSNDCKDWPDDWEICDYHSQDITFVAAACICNPWVDDTCGAAGCAPNQMRQTRSCNPAGCDIESQCVNDSCTPWVNDACGAGGCTADKMHQTRTCTYHCLPESQCLPDPACLPPPVCVPDGICDGSCPAPCGPADVDIDHDCGCKDGNGCCGIGCNNANDDDCLAKIEAPDCPTYCSDQNIYDPPSGFICICSLTKWEKFEKLIGGIIDFIFWVAIAIVPIMIIIAAFYFLTSGGDPEKVRKAKSIIFWTIIGFTIVLLAKGIISVIKQIIGG